MVASEGAPGAFGFVGLASVDRPTLPAVGELVVVLVGVAIVVATLLVSRRARERSRLGARTVELRIDPAGVTRRLGDGRAEGAAWSALVEVEVVHTPLPTADGARVFAVLAESEERGCLVPLGVGYDEFLLVELTRLPGFDLRRFEQVMAEAKNGRTTVWAREQPDEARGGQPGESTDGTGSSE
jgi:hypothetical protein